MEQNIENMKQIIEEEFENRAEITPKSVKTQTKEAVNCVLDNVDSGILRVAEKIDGQWIVNDWIKKAVLLSFRIEDNAFMKGGFTNYYDKVESKYSNYNPRDFRESGVRVVPPATARKGAYIAPSVVLMPSYVNIGAYVDSGTMVDTWSTVGSCAQIGKNVHLSGGVGIGGVLEPVQASPTIIEDNCFIGMSATVMDGAVVEKGAMVAAGALVTPGKRVESGQLWAGTPAKYIRDISAAEIEMMTVIPPRYVALGQEYLAASKS